MKPGCPKALHGLVHLFPQTPQPTAVLTHSAIFLLAQRTDFCISKAVPLALFANMARHNTEVLAEAWLFPPC